MALPTAARGREAAGDQVTASPRPEALRLPVGRASVWGRVQPYLYLAPAGLLLFAFQLWPILNGAWISLHRWGLRNMGFVGLTNYARVLNDPEWWRSLKTTAFYVAGTVPLELVLGLSIATLLFGRLKGRAVYRAIYFLPYVTPLAAIGVVWGWLFNGRFGLVNALLGSLGVHGPDWLLEPTGLVRVLAAPLGVEVPPAWEGPSLALVAVMVVTVWHYLGFHVVVYLSGLTQVPREIWDAADVDGATGWQRFRHLTVPLLSPTTYFLSLVATIGAFQSITLIYVMTGMGWGASGASGAPLGTTRVAMLYVFDQFFTYTRVGYAMAAAMLLFLVILALTLLQMRAGRRRTFYFGGGEG